MTQHAASEMAFSRLGLSRNVKVRRHFKSDIHRDHMQTKLSSLRFMLFIKGPAKEARGKRKKKKRTETAGVKTPTKIFTAELRKYAE